MISLIVATVGRVAELERLLTSLDAQTYKDFEVIVVDQNKDERLVPVLQRHLDLRVSHLRSAPGLSRARNVGLRVVQGDVVTFPDDDCWYPEQLLAAVVEWFNGHADYDALFTGTRSPEGQLLAPKGAPGAGPCTRKNVLSCVVAFTGFLRKRVTDAVGGFNQKIGVGSPSTYQSGEDLDYFIRPLTCNFRMWYEPALTIYHPDFRSIERLRRTAYGYALGVGYVMRAHRYPVTYLNDYVLRCLGQAVLSLGKAKLQLAQVYLVRGVGLIRGYFFGPKELAGIADPPMSDG